MKFHVLVLPLRAFCPLVSSSLLLRVSGCQHARNLYRSASNFSLWVFLEAYILACLQLLSASPCVCSWTTVSPAEKLEQLLKLSYFWHKIIWFWDSLDYDCLDWDCIALRLFGVVQTAWDWASAGTSWSQTCRIPNLELPFVICGRERSMMQEKQNVDEVSSKHKLC